MQVQEKEKKTQICTESWLKSMQIHIITQQERKKACTTRITIIQARRDEENTNDQPLTTHLPLLTYPASGY